MAQLDAYSYRHDHAVPDFDDARPILIFDGYCALCSGMARFVLEYDRRGAVRLATAQSTLGEALFRHFGLKNGDYSTNILLFEGRALEKSDGSLKLFELLGPPWSLLAVARLAPKDWRDALYNIIARNRLRWFGARETCFAPSTVEAGRFIQ